MNKEVKEAIEHIKAAEATFTKLIKNRRVSQYKREQHYAVRLSLETARKQIGNKLPWQLE